MNTLTLRVRKKICSTKNVKGRNLKKKRLTQPKGLAKLIGQRQ